MKIKGVILTGTSGAGKSSIAKKLVYEVKEYSFEEAKALTTRKKRKDDDGHYYYLEEEEFEKKRGGFFTSTEYREKKYAVTEEEIEQIISRGKIPILTIGPESFSQLAEGKKEEFLSFFIDEDDKMLDARLEKRDHPEDFVKIHEQRERDRKYADSPNYIVLNHKVEDTSRLIVRLIEQFEKGGLLSEKDISLLISGGMLIKGGLEKNIKGASYDLTLGEEYYYAGEIKRIEDSLRVTIEPYDYAIVCSKEDIALPKDIAAHFGLTVGLFCQGIILSNGQQVDPGYRGKLLCLLFNTSNKSVTIKRNEHYATIEFTKMNQFASKYKGKYQEKKDIIDFIPGNAMQGALSELKKEIEELRKESRNMQSIYIGVISIIIAAISILLILK